MGSGQRGLLERSERGGESYIRLQRTSVERLFLLCTRKKVRNKHQENKGSGGNPGAPADKSGEEDKGS